MKFGLGEVELLAGAVDRRRHATGPANVDRSVRRASLIRVTLPETAYSARDELGHLVDLARARAVTPGADEHDERVRDDVGLRAVEVDQLSAGDAPVSANVQSASVAGAASTQRARAARCGRRR